MSTFDVIVIGEGVAGLTAAGQLAAAGLQVATFEQQIFGGLVLNVNELDPAPAGGEAGGAAFAAELIQSNGDAGVTSIQEPVTAVATNASGFQVTTDSGNYQARQVIVASGARLKNLNVAGESEFEGRGVSKCADCDGPMFQNESVVVVGGGDSALQEAQVLTQYCGKVHLVHRGNAFSAKAHFIEHITHNDKIQVHFGTTVEAILGGQMVERVSLNTASGTTELACAGVFAYIGLEPNQDFLDAAIARDAKGFITTQDNLETSCPGLWAIGAVRSGCGGTLADAMTEAQQVATTLKQRLQ